MVSASIFLYNIYRRIPREYLMEVKHGDKKIPKRVG